MLCPDGVVVSKNRRKVPGFPGCSCCQNSRTGYQIRPDRVRERPGPRRSPPLRCAVPVSPASSWRFHACRPRTRKCTGSDQPLESRPDVRLDRLEQISQVDICVDVRKRGGDENSTHGIKQMRTNGSLASAARVYSPWRAEFAASTASDELQSRVIVIAIGVLREGKPRPPHKLILYVLHKVRTLSPTAPEPA